MPTEYCEYSGVTEQCLEWLQANLPEEFTKLDLTNIQKTVEAEKKHQKRGGKVIITINSFFFKLLRFVWFAIHYNTKDRYFHAFFRAHIIFGMNAVKSISSC